MAFTVADLAKTWVTEDPDIIVSRYVGSWLDFPVSTKLTSLVLTKSQFGLNLQMPSVKVTQCQTVSHNIYRSSLNLNIQAFWKNTSYGTNLQYDMERNTKEVLKVVKSGIRECLAQFVLTSCLTLILVGSLTKKLNEIWFGV